MKEEMSETLRSALEFARSVLGVASPSSSEQEHRTPNQSQNGEHAIVDRTCTAAVDRERSRSFSDGATTITAIAHRGDFVGVVSTRLAAEDIRENIACATLEIPSIYGHEPQALRFSVAEIKRLRSFLGSSAGDALIEWVVASAAGVASGVVQSADSSTSGASERVVGDCREPAAGESQHSSWQEAEKSAQVDKRLEYWELLAWATERWDDADALDDAYRKFHENLLHWRLLFGPRWNGPIEFEEFNKRARHLRASRAGPDTTSVTGKAQSLGQAARNQKQGGGSPPGVPVWPCEAAYPATTALQAGKFFHSTGMLSFMGYRVGRCSELSSERRRRILDYILRGPLPLVNDRLYMQEWGRPKTSHRLRKLANSLAAFARNARRKRSENWGEAIRDWEEDLAYLKRRYYGQRRRDWKWPETVRSRRQ